MEDKTIAAEEKLLNLIRRKEVKTEENVIASVKKKSERITLGKSFFSSINIKIVNLLLFLCVCVSMFFLLIKYVNLNNPENLSNVVGLTQKKNKKSLAQNVKSDVRQIKNFSEYENRLGKRDLFKTLWEESTPEVKIVEKKTATVDLNDRIRLIGLVLDDDPKAIVENLSSHQTVFLSIGDSYEGAKLTQIKEESIVFEVNGTEVFIEK